MINSKLTLGEIAAIEELSGRSIATLDDNEQPQGKMLAALVYVTKKREDQTFSFKQAMDMDFEEAAALLGLGEDEDPKSEN